MGGELWPMIRGKVIRDSKPCDPVSGESSGAHLPAIFLQARCVLVNDCEEVGFVFRAWKWTNKVYMDAAEASVWEGPLNKRGMDVALYF